MTNSSKETVLILGAGQAGGQCAASLRRSGFTGQVILAGDEQHPPYQRPPLSKAYLSGEVTQDRLWLQSPETWQEQSVELRLGANATRITTATKCVSFENGPDQHYSHLVLATGSRVRPLPVVGADLDGVRYLRNIADVDALKVDFAPGKRIAVIGGGYIGLEAASVARKLGARPIVIEAMDRLLARVATPPLSDFYLKAHRAHDVEVRLTTTVEALRGINGRVSAVLLGDGSEIACDSVLVGIGVLPNQEIAAEAGLNVENGIVTDENCQTSDPTIYAIGDCANGINRVYHRRMRLESVPNAIEQAKLAAATICKQPSPKPETPWFWSDQFDFKLQSAGIVTGVDKTIVRGDPANGSFALFHLAAGHLIAADAVNDPPSFMAAKMMIANGAAPDPAHLADTNISMKDIMRGTVADQ
ncbi:MAG: FAD-dependent oxidoreductase [Maricaulis sp.]|nr:FAD-dependent oxidoreductase [Maricaulis sp.]MDG2043870.1 FAD-dependent oxidoreductase [Maricaulis sp.]